MSAAHDKPITLRNLPPALSRVVHQRARKKRISLNRAVIDLLEEATGLHRPPIERVKSHDLDHLAGTWSQEVADDFQKALAETRKVDPEMWR